MARPSFLGSGVPLQVLARSSLWAFHYTPSRSPPVAGVVLQKQKTALLTLHFHQHFSDSNTLQSYLRNVHTFYKISYIYFCLGRLV